VKRIACESPVYAYAKLLFESLGNELVGLHLDPFGGIDLAAWDRALAHKPSLAYLIPSFHNPTGYSYTSAELRGVLEVAPDDLEQDAGRLRLGGIHPPEHPHLGDGHEGPQAEDQPGDRDDRQRKDGAVGEEQARAEEQGDGGQQRLRAADAGGRAGQGRGVLGELRPRGGGLVERGQRLDGGRHPFETVDRLREPGQAERERAQRPKRLVERGQLVE